MCQIGGSSPAAGKRFVNAAGANAEHGQKYASYAEPPFPLVKQRLIVRLSRLHLRGECWLSGTLGLH